jgi:hypothetical protein
MMDDILIGQVKSKHSEKLYSVKWNPSTKNVWIQNINKEVVGWFLVAKEVENEKDGIFHAQKFIDGQPNRF